MSTEIRWATFQLYDLLQAHLNHTVEVATVLDFAQLMHRKIVNVEMAVLSPGNYFLRERGTIAGNSSAVSSASIRGCLGCEDVRGITP